MSLSQRQRERIIYEAMLLNVDVRVLQNLAPFLFIENITAANREAPTPHVPVTESTQTEFGVTDEGPQYDPNDDYHYPM